MPLTLAAARALGADVQRQRRQGRDVIADRKAAKERQRSDLKDRSSTTFAGCVRAFIDDEETRKKRGWHWSARLLGLHYDDNGKPQLIKAGLADRWRICCLGC